MMFTDIDHSTRGRGSLEQDDRCPACGNMTGDYPTTYHWDRQETTRCPHCGVWLENHYSAPRGFYWVQQVTYG